jgi:hypothetical protein
MLRRTSDSSLQAPIANRAKDIINANRVTAIFFNFIGFSLHEKGTGNKKAP